MNILAIKNISKYYHKHTALKDINLNIPKGSIFGLLGPNGAGKTSLIRIITQITRADEGEVFFDGKPLQPKHIHTMGYLPEERGLYKKMNVAEQLMYLARLKGLPATQARQQLAYWLDKFQIKAWANKKIEKLSKGMQQKVQFIATVIHRPALIILDEPFSGFDPVNANLVKDQILALRDRGASVIFSTHRMESVEELCDDIALIDRAKKVLSGKKSEIKAQYKTNTFILQTSNPIENLSSAYQIVSATQENENTHQTKVKIITGNTNSLLTELMQQTKIYGLKEHIPSINDIFIAAIS